MIGSQVRTASSSSKVGDSGRTRSRARGHPKDVVYLKYTASPQSHEAITCSSMRLQVIPTALHRPASSSHSAARRQLCVDEGCSAAVDRDVTVLGSHRSVVWFGSMLRVLRVELIPLDFLE